MKIFLQTLLNFAEQMGEAKPKGLSRVEIDQLPTYRVTAASKNEDDDKRCVVCLVDFEEKQLVRVLPCLHEYHTRCIDKWLKVIRYLKDFCEIYTCRNVKSNEYFLLSMWYKVPYQCVA